MRNPLWNQNAELRPNVVAKRGKNFKIINIEMCLVVRTIDEATALNL